MEYYLALKRKAIVTHTLTWMNFKEIAQFYKDTYVWFHLNEVGMAWRWLLEMENDLLFNGSEVCLGT
jgi:hypothetical protein